MNRLQLKPTKLSICIATYNRGQFISETLDSIVTQLSPGVEIVIVDGASPDNTQEVITQYLSSYPEIRYFREQKNSGVDHDYDKAVGYAKGEYCWLMTDDDLLYPSAISTVFSALMSGEDLIVVNSEVRNKDLSIVLESQILEPDSGRMYNASNSELFFATTAKYLSFIGSIVIRRASWLSRDRSSYYGTLFIHVGVIFQSPPIASVRVIDEPLIIIRYGNAMWTARGFEIWMLKWPNLIWSFPDFSDMAKRKVCRREPWRSIKVMLKNRALGIYSRDEYYKLWSNRTRRIEGTIAYFLSIFPASLANFIMVFSFFLSTKNKSRGLYDLLRSPHAGVLSRLLVKVLG